MKASSNKKKKVKTTRRNRNTNKDRAFIIVGIVLWLIACFLPAYVAVGDSSSSIVGLGAFFWGFFTIANPLNPLFITWLSNFFWLAFLLVKTTKINRDRDGLLGIFAVGCSLLVFVPLSEPLMFSNESDIRPAHLAIGGVVWFVAILTPVLPEAARLWRKITK